MRVTIFGTGYVGLVTGACLADAGNHVLCVDIDEEKIARLNRGEIPIYEPGLEAMVKQRPRSRPARTSRRTPPPASRTACSSSSPSARRQDEDGSADLQHVLTVARSIGEHLDDYRIIVDKSTVPVGTADRRSQREMQGALDRRGVQRRVRRRIESGVFEGRCGDRRFHEAGSDHRRYG